MWDFLKISPSSLLSDFITYQGAVYRAHHKEDRAVFWLRLIIFCALMIAIPFVLGTYELVSITTMSIWGMISVGLSAGALFYTYVKF